ncbi:uncharacterized protein [Haliotis cracherodii]|uniref:uncharacterized protein n=1 Tax=Haliotis cracherodii TaxID=6455 RepID=UPI0039EBE8CF
MVRSSRRCIASVCHCPRSVVLLLMGVATLLVTNYMIHQQHRYNTVDHMGGKQLLRNGATTSGTPPLPSDDLFLVESVQSIPYKTDLDKEYWRRREHIKYVCNADDLRRLTREKWTEQLWHFKSLNILYCPLENHDTVIWRKTSEIWMRSQTDSTSFLLDWGRFKGSEYRNTVTGEQAETFVDMFNTSLKVLYTRDPYWQLFEYYVNNIVVPSNESLQLGKQITLNHKDSPSKSNIECGHNVSFVEFTQFVMSSKENGSFAGTVNHCDVCGIDFDVIGKEDTFEQDTLYVYNKLKSPDKVSAFEDFQREYDFSIIEGFVETAFTRKNNITCISTYSMYLRLWRQLQIWGYISKNISFPYTKEESLSLEYYELLNASLRAYNSSIPMSRSNRFEAISQAYHVLSLSELNALRALYVINFYLFDYNDRPGLIYFKQAPQSDFSFFDIIVNQE